MNCGNQKSLIMKKIMMSFLATAWLAIPAMAQSSSSTSNSGTYNCPAATCTNHSYDGAYNQNMPAGRSMARNSHSRQMVSGKSVCMAATCTDHSYDGALSTNWSGQSQSPAPSVVRVSSSPNVRTWGGMRDRHYDLNNFTVRERHAASMNAPYNGYDAPSYDGAAKNKYRNMRANNESEPLPPLDGNK